jgi:small GTP-binding protein
MSNSKSPSIYESFRGAPSKKSLKIAIVGDGAVGKSCYFDRLAHGHNDEYRFSRNYNATIGCDVCQLVFKIGRHEVTVHLFDTAGQEKFGKLRDSYIMGADGVICMYDLTQRETKTNVMSKWIPDIMKTLDNSNCKNYVPVIVVGNKHDKVAALTSAQHDLLKIRSSALSGCYKSRYGSIAQCMMSVKADENLMNPINWLLQNILGYYLPVNAERGDTSL